MRDADGVRVSEGMRGGEMCIADCNRPLPQHHQNTIAPPLQSKKLIAYHSNARYNAIAYLFDGLQWCQTYVEHTITSTFSSANLTCTGKDPATSAQNTLRLSCEPNLGRIRTVCSNPGRGGTAGDPGGIQKLSPGTTSTALGRFAAVRVRC